MVNLKAGMAVPLDPFLITQNNWPSGRDFIISAQVKFLGVGSNPRAKRPLPLPRIPWHILQDVGFESV